MRAARPALILISAASTLLLSACSLRVISPGAFPEPKVFLEVVPYHQEPRHCGPFALAAVLDYLGKKGDPGEIARDIYSPNARGASTMDLYLEARRRGLESEQLQGTREKLREELEKGFPVIVLVKYPGLEKKAGHFVVLNGYSLTPPGFFLLWGDGRISWMKDERLEDLWSGSGFWALTFSGGADLDP